jgi:hypothetical protein
LIGTYPDIVQLSFFLIAANVDSRLISSSLIVLCLSALIAAVKAWAG